MHNIEIKPTPKIDSKSFLRWAGSKKKIVPILLNHMGSNFNKYLEPFVGSAQLFFASKPKHAILSDTNKSLIDCYQAVKVNPEKVYSNLSELPFGKDNYYLIRALDTKDWDLEKRAARFIYLNTYCFNGLYRTNKQGYFNVPYSETSSKMLSYDQLILVSKNLQNASFLTGDFEQIIDNNCEDGDFVYLDPPYAIRNKDIFVQYGPETFGLSDISRLQSCIKRIDEKGAHFLLSYAYCDEALDIASKWNHKIISTVRNISGFAKHRKTENEILISNRIFND